MKTEIEAAMKKLVDKSTGAQKGDDALKFSQAALNLAHAFATLENAKKQK